MTSRDLTGYLDDDGQARLCVARLTQAFTGLLGATGPAAAPKWRDLAELAREVGDLCAERARDLDPHIVEGTAGPEHQR